MSVPKISSISMIFRPNHIKKTLPVLAAPLLAYYIGENQDNNANEILIFILKLVKKYFALLAAKM